ncbi:MAG: restriction endonuclease [Verrucomicrobiales bacterium]|nr:restriction endonuclease [Verrucomicrobiales bacterium]
MSVARHYAEWLSLVETSGPFLSMPVLLRVFPQGLDKRDPATASRLREAYEDWLERHNQPAVHHAWIRHVLTQLLDYPPEFLVEGQAIPPGTEAVMANFGETLRPDFVLLARSSPSPPPEGGEDRGVLGRSDANSGEVGPSRKPLLLLDHYPPDQDLDKPVAGKLWKASPGTRMMELLHATGVPLGLVTNGEEWMLVYAPRGETTGFASWYADLWMQEPITLQAFHSFLHLRRFLGVAEPDTLAALYAESAKDQQEVTDQLGYQVRRAVEMLVQAFDRVDADSGRKLLAGVNEQDLYDSALTVMMRLVFLFCAEERGLLLLGDPLYDQHYAVSTLSELLRERADQHGEEVLERRHDAWSRLLATFRAVHGGVEHEAMRLPPYGGTLFDPDRYPFLEGRADSREREAGSGKRKTTAGWRYETAKPLPINNRVVLHLLEALQFLRVKVPGGGPAEARRLSFRALDIEQIGHVYEGLLDHTARRANEVILGLAGSRNAEPEIPLSKLEELAGRTRGAFDLQAEAAQELPLAADKADNVIPLPTGAPMKGYGPPEALVEFLRERTKRSPKAIIKALTDPSRVDANRLLLACNQDRQLLDRVWRLAALLRTDDFDQPVVIREGSVYVTAGSDRRSTGTHYTPRSLTEPIVRHTLEPLVYLGPAEGKPQAEWQLKSPRDILALKVCDMAMGSGAFLVQACRYLAERLVEAWELEEQRLKSEVGVSNFFVVLPDGSLSLGAPGERLLPADPAERLALARRYVADRCLYGVDINPMAVEMAKLSLWLVTLQRDRPFTFLDHDLKCGDSLLGVSALAQVENFSLRPGERQVTFGTANLFRYVEEASAKRRELENLPSHDHAQIETKLRLYAEAEAATARVKAIADCLIAFELRGLDGDAYEEERARAADHVQLLMQRDADQAMATHPGGVIDTANQTPLAPLQGADHTTPETGGTASLNPRLPSASPPGWTAACTSPLADRSSLLANYAREHLRGRRPFHWPVEFPEVAARDGFDAFVGNPPFVGGRRIRSTLGEGYLNWLTTSLSPNASANADLCAFFFCRGHALLKKGGHLGLLATNTIAQGDTRSVGLDALATVGCTIPRAISSRVWPGTANVFVSEVWLRRGSWNGSFCLDGKVVPGISPSLTAIKGTAAKPHRLHANECKSYQGSILLGMGFVLEEAEADALIQRDDRNRAVLFPYLDGQDLNSRADQSPSRWAICFFDWPLKRAEIGEWSGADHAQRRIWRKSGVVPLDYPEPVAADYPDCLKIVEAKVRPERLAKSEEIATAPWWQFWRVRGELYSTVKGMKRVLVRAQVSRTHAPVFYTPNIIFSMMTIVFALEDDWRFAVLQSNIHEAWLDDNSSSLKDDRRYTPTDSFETFPFPANTFTLSANGNLYHDHRKEVMASRDEGLTDTYNRFHDPAEQSADIARLRTLHVEMDQAVALAYGWPILVNGQVVNPEPSTTPGSPLTAHHSPVPDPLDLGHGFHETKQGVRYTLSESARRIVLDRLLALNHQRYEEEVKAGLHDKKKRVASGKRRTARGERGTPSEEQGRDSSERGAARGERGGTAKVPAPAGSEAQLTLDMGSEPAPKQAPAAAPKAVASDTSPRLEDITHRDLLNAIFTCASRREVTDREDLAREVAHDLGFQRLGSRIQDLIASAINSAIRRGLIGYDARNIHRLAPTYADLDPESLVAAINATLKPGCVYTPNDAIVLAADYLGNKRMTDPFRERLESALLAASRRGLIVRRGEEIRKVT